MLRKYLVSLLAVLSLGSASGAVVLHKDGSGFFDNKGFFRISMQQKAALRSSSSADAEYVDLKCDKEAIHFCFDSKKQQEASIVGMKRSKIIALLGVATAAVGAGVAVKYDNKTAIIPASLGAIGALYGLAAMWYYSLPDMKKNAVFRVIDTTGFYDENTGKIEWADIERVEVHHNPKVLLSGLLITLSTKTIQGKPQQQVVCGSLAGMMVLADLLLKGRALFAGKLDTSALVVRTT